MMDYIAYYRVSTAKQGASGLGLDAQREAIQKYLRRGDTLVAEFTEVESGKRVKNRPQLEASLTECKKRKAVLLIAKLDRLARNVHFISGLMESKVEFKALDLPDANQFTIHIMAAVAEHEAKIIGERTKVALAQAKKRGVRIGNPNPIEAAAVARAAHYPNPPKPEVVKLISDWHTVGRSYRGIAIDLNRLGILTPQKCQWYAETVKRVLSSTAGK